MMGLGAPDHAALYPTAGLYVHIPFCARKCLYCDFPSFAGEDARMAPYTAALAAEIASTPTADVHSVFFGGGTPSYLPLPLMAEVMAALHARFNLLPGAEITMEVNPGNEGLHAVAGAAAFEAYRAMGFNRLSLGVQSFDPALLAKLGRIHSPQDAHEAVAAARGAGFENISIDLMYGLPGQSLATWQATLETAIGLDLPHLSCYSLIVEPDTPFEAMERRGRLRLPTEEAESEMAAWARERLAAAGYTHYEISNWAKPGRQCQHNLTYWRNQPWVGVGSGAHGYRDRHRTANPPVIADYLARSPQATTSQPLHEEMEETMFMGLRLVDEGVSNARFRARFGQDLAAVYGDVFPALADRGLITWDGELVRLAPAGIPLANDVFAAVLLDGGVGVV